MKVQELLTRETWIQGDFARNKDGKVTHELDDDAVCFCLWGALTKCYGDEAGKVRDRIYPLIGQWAVFAWNDSVTWEDVEKLIKELDI